jgi:hypothetical protein
MCYAPVAGDARVTNQIRWLEQAGYRVDILSRGPEHPDATGTPLKIGYPPLWKRVLLHAAMTPPARFRKLVGDLLPEMSGRTYDLVVVNDLHLLPWAVDAIPALTSGPVTLDLHEVYAGNGTGLSYKLLIEQYDEWLCTFIDAPVFSRRLTVANGIADLYHDRYGIERPEVIRNVAPYEDLTPSPVDPERILLVHHGFASQGRGIDVMLDAALRFEPRFTLVLMVLGEESELGMIRRHAAVRSGRAVLRDPVGVSEVARALNDCDLEVIFFPPRFANNVYALPNKFFEAVQARLGVIIGHSPEIEPFVRTHALGLVVDGWGVTQLVDAVNALTPDEIAAMKRGSDAAALTLSTRGEGPRFLAAIGA